ncbi:MAG: dethiobiotin synthase [Chitinivibrionales bacterium]
MNPKNLFITATDTGAGKTFISRILLDTLAYTHKTAYFKPVLTGCSNTDKSAQTIPDFDYVCRDGNHRVADTSTHVPYTFEPECSPHLAASLSGKEINSQRIEQAFRSIQKVADIVVSEGAGGLMVPVNSKEYMIDLIRLTQSRVILVTTPQLGTLNHTFLSLEALRCAGLKTAGIVFNNIHGSEKDYIYRDNLKTVKEYSHGIPVLEAEYSQEPDKKVEGFCKEITKGLE